MNKTLIILRHAHRDQIDGHDADNGLSERGLAQTEKLVKYFEKRFKGTRAFFISSPKRRCVETLAPIAAACGGKLEKDPLLAEQGASDPVEKPKAFASRLKQFHSDWLDSKHRLTVICSHGDWIPAFLERTVGVAITLKKGGYAEIDVDDEGKRLRLRYLIQEFF